MNTSASDGQHSWPSMNRNPADIEREIDGTRRELDRTIDALQSKLSPQQRLRALGQGAQEYAGRLTRSARDAMMPGITGMIRLDHTHVLALFRRFRPWTSESKKEALVANACIALEIHAELEEEIFYPAMRNLGGDHGILDKSVPEHDEMRRQIGKLRDMRVSDPTYDESVWNLMRTVLHHVADEESTLLPLAERYLAGQLGELGIQMTKRRIELLRPHLAMVARTSARSFPVATAALAAGMLVLGWAVLRPRVHDR